MIQYDEYGNPLPPGYTPPEDPYLQQLDQINQPPPVGSAEQPQPLKMDPQKFLKEQYGIGTTGPLADKQNENIQNYQAGVNQSEDVTGQGAPQQFGTEEPMGQDLGPLSPQETAERMPTSKDAMSELIKKHMLPSLPQASKDGYDNYVTASREKRAAEKAQLRQQGALNRADAASKDADVVNKMGGFNPYNFAVNNGMLQGGNRVTREGGYTFVHGHMRPMGDDEQAKLNETNARTDYMRQRPDIAHEANQVKREGFDLRKTLADARAGNQMAIAQLREQGMNDRQIKALTQQDEHFEEKRGDKAAAGLEQTRLEFDQGIKKLRELEGFADKQAGSTPDKRPSNWATYLDSEYDPKSKKFIPKPGLYGSSADRVLEMADKIDRGWQDGTYHDELPDDIKDYIRTLRMARRGK